MQRNFPYTILSWHTSPQLCNSVKPELSSTSAQVPHVAIMCIALQFNHFIMNSISFFPLQFYQTNNTNKMPDAGLYRDPRHSVSLIVYVLFGTIFTST